MRPRLRFTLDAPLPDVGLGSLGAAIGATVRGTDGVARYEVVDAPPSPALVAALATWCLDAGRLVVESRAVGGTLEDAYLELVGTASADAGAS
jgi:hypothetical protein